MSACLVHHYFTGPNCTVSNFSHTVPSLQTQMLYITSTLTVRLDSTVTVHFPHANQLTNSTTILCKRSHSGKVWPKAWVWVAREQSRSQQGKYPERQELVYAPFPSSGHMTVSSYWKVLGWRKTNVLLYKQGLAAITFLMHLDKYTHLCLSTHTHTYAHTY